jgi:ATP-binding cassette, subfamily D (ALD), member 3
VDKKKKKKINVDGVFLERLINILKIAIPGVYTKEFEYFIILTVLLFSRTILTVQIAEILGTNAQFLVGRKYTDLLIGVAKFQFLSFNKIDSLL